MFFCRWNLVDLFYHPKVSKYLWELYSIGRSGFCSPRFSCRLTRGCHEVQCCPIQLHNGHLLVVYWHCSGFVSLAANAWPAYLGVRNLLFSRLYPHGPFQLLSDPLICCSGHIHRLRYQRRLLDHSYPQRTLHPRRHWHSQVSNLTHILSTTESSWSAFHWHYWRIAKLFANPLLDPQTFDYPSTIAF